MADTPGPRNPFEDADLRRRIFYTLGALTIFRVGTFIPLPRVDTDALNALIDAQSGGVLDFLNVFSGGALGRFALFSLGVMPYVNAQVLAGLFKGGQGRRGRGGVSRGLTLVLALLQSLALAFALAKMTAPGGVAVVARPDAFFYAATTLTLTAGALFAMWLCEEITESGIGGGALLIVFAGLVGNVVSGAGTLFRLVRYEEVGLFAALAIVAALIAAVMSAVWVETAQRKLTVNYAQRIVGRRMYGGAQSSLPMKLDQSGVVAAVSAAIFATSLFALLLAAVQLFPQSALGRRLPPLLSRGSWIDDAVYAALIILFCSFSVAPPIDANELAENIKKSGGSIPGVRPGDATARHLQWLSARLALGGALFVAAIAVVPDILRRIFNLPFFFDGFQILILVGVALDAMGRIETYGMRRAYAKSLK